MVRTSPGVVNLHNIKTSKHKLLLCMLIRCFQKHVWAMKIVLIGILFSAVFLALKDPQMNGITFEHTSHYVTTKRFHFTFKDGKRFFLLLQHCQHRKLELRVYFTYTCHNSYTIKNGPYVWWSKPFTTTNRIYFVI